MVGWASLTSVPDECPLRMPLTARATVICCGPQCRLSKLAVSEAVVAALPSRDRHPTDPGSQITVRHPESCPPGRLRRPSQPHLHGQGAAHDGQADGVPGTRRIREPRRVGRPSWVSPPTRFRSVSVIAPDAATCTRPKYMLVAPLARTMGKMYAESHRQRVQRPVEPEVLGRLLTRRRGCAGWCPGGSWSAGRPRRTRRSRRGRRRGASTARPWVPCPTPADTVRPVNLLGLPSDRRCRWRPRRRPSRRTGSRSGTPRS
ncbi:hypothetical protein SCALM49S_02464 [Streptomyces californicus]